MGRMSVEVVSPAKRTLPGISTESITICFAVVWAFASYISILTKFELVKMQSPSSKQEVIKTQIATKKKARKREFFVRKYTFSCLRSRSGRGSPANDIAKRFLVNLRLILPVTH